MATIDSVLATKFASLQPLIKVCVEPCLQFYYLTLVSVHLASGDRCVTNSNPFCFCQLLLHDHVLVMIMVVNFCLSVSLFLSVLSRSLSKPTMCRQQGPPQSQVRETVVLLSHFRKANRWSSLLPFRPLALYWVVFDSFWARGSPVPLRVVL